MIVMNAGMPKSGTKSFASAMEILGWNSYHNDPEILKILCRRPRTRYPALNLQGKVATSNLGEWRWRDLHNVYPDALFVCTYRQNKAAWLRSTYGMMKRQAGRGWEGAWKWTYGTPFFYEPLIENALLMHDYDFERWAKRRGARYLMLEVGDGWGPLCEALGVDVPDCDYPWKHKGGEY